MKFALFILFNLLLFCSTSYARNIPEDYWKSKMKGQPMPDAIKGLLNQDPSTLPRKNYHSTSEIGNENRFNRNFDTRPIAIIYHKQVPSEDGKHVVKTSNPVQEGKTKEKTNAADDIKRQDKDSHN